ncbi:MAG: glycosyltransferase family 4 protein [Candidatus Krumholzibacteriota bacterium]|nr:glycosyltransferase family 4 protein [Candidatus Krumholzibacteriota bacterium]
MRVLLVSEEITDRPAEGLVVFVMHLRRYLEGKHDLTAAYQRGSPARGPEVKKLLRGRFHIGREFRRFLRREKFDKIIYVPSSGLTALGLLRGILIGWISRADTILIGLQERRIGVFHRLQRLLPPPAIILTPVARMREDLEKAGFTTGFIIPGIEGDKFRPVAGPEKARLREKYRLPGDGYIVLHVGHIKESRNVETFLDYRRWGEDITMVFKCGQADPVWKKRLQDSGIVVMEEYTDDIHEIYQACDCYLFPVKNLRGALDFPLSVIEAAACGLPVVTTRYGTLPEMFGEGQGYRYFDNMEKIAGKIREVRNSPFAAAHLAAGLSWREIFSKHLEPHLAAAGGKRKGSRG